VNCSPCDQSFEFQQRGKINSRLAKVHACTDHGICHPAGYGDEHTRGAFHSEKPASRAILDTPDTYFEAETGVPPIIDFPLFADMGRMNG